MVEFGDFDPADALDTAPADPEQVARRIHRLRYEHGFEIERWEQLTDSERSALVTIVVALLAWGRRQGIFR